MSQSELKSAKSLNCEQLDHIKPSCNATKESNRYVGGSFYILLEVKALACRHNEPPTSINFKWTSQNTQTNYGRFNWAKIRLFSGQSVIRVDNLSIYNPVTPLVRFLSEGKDFKLDRLSPRQRTKLHRYELADGLLHYRVDPRDPPRVVVPNDEDLKYDILLEAHDAPMSGHLGREKTYQMVSQTFWWPRMYKWVAHYVKKCDPCQRVKPSGYSLLGFTPEPSDCWKSMSLDFVFGLPADDKGNTGIFVFVCRLSKMVHFAPVRDKVTGKQAAQLFLDSVFRYHVSDRDPRFTGAFWDTLFQLLETKLTMSTADHQQTDGQTERDNRVLEDTLRGIYAEAPRS
ncbi:Pol protein [Phytophthora palmivora]|uniref:Pol protein n=1 Tax=Phytophthora palmivora TaxID=4796 RepID=A0A2P4X2R2_9STRA|nr:Pol protein [Phytophthora palmivora]